MGQDTGPVSRVPAIPTDASPLAVGSTYSFCDLFGGNDLDAAWLESNKAISEFFPDTPIHGVNPGDRRALYYLVRRLAPRSALEIGTHLGTSTLHIAMALKANRNSDVTSRLVTVDLKDVNDESRRPWARFGVQASPRSILNRLHCGELVEFCVSHSLDYLTTTDDTFDFVFLDGSHDAWVVYQELPAALRLLRTGGCILLHDYFPGGKPLWSNGRVIPGPYRAIRRLRREGATLVALPLGALPWPTKYGSTVTSLAIVARDEARRTWLGRAVARLGR